jgi:DNA-binding XRE family transcriptional regulator
MKEAADLITSVRTFRLFLICTNLQKICYNIDMKLKEVGMLAKRYRKEKGLTQEQLAQKVGVSVRWLSRLEKNESSNLQFDKVQNVLEYLGYDLRVEKRPELSAAHKAFFQKWGHNV